MSPLRRLVAEHMVVSKRVSPHVGTVAEVDLGGVVRVRDAHKEEFRAAHGFALSFLPFVVHACVRAFNAKARGVWAWAAAAVPDDFSARRARARWYRYVLSDDHDPGILAVALGVFVGDHDFRNFTRDHARTVVRIDEATARREGDTVVLDFRAPRFRWNLVRRLVAAAMIVEAGRITVGDVENALRSRTRVDYGLAPPEPLTLMDVVYDGLVFEAVTDHTTLSRVRRLLGNQRRSMALLAQIETRFREGQKIDDSLNV